MKTKNWTWAGSGMKALMDLRMMRIHSQCNFLTKLRHDVRKSTLIEVRKKLIRICLKRKSSERDMIELDNWLESEVKK